MQLELPVRSCSSPGLLALLIWSSLHPNTSPTESTCRSCPRDAHPNARALLLRAQRVLCTPRPIHTEPRRTFLLGRAILTSLVILTSSFWTERIRPVSDYRHMATRCSVAISPPHARSASDDHWRPSPYHACRTGALRKSARFFFVPRAHRAKG